MIGLAEVPLGSIWAHTNGVQYRVVKHTNVEGTKPKYPTTVCYQNIANGKEYSRPLNDWARSMTLVELTPACGHPAIDMFIVDGMIESLTKIAAGWTNPRELKSVHAANLISAKADLRKYVLALARVGQDYREVGLDWKKRADAAELALKDVLKEGLYVEVETGIGMVSEKTEAHVRAQALVDGLLK